MTLDNIRERFRELIKDVFDESRPEPDGCQLTDLARFFCAGVLEHGQHRLDIAERSGDAAATTLEATMLSNLLRELEPVFTNENWTAGKEWLPQ